MHGLQLAFKSVYAHGGCICLSHQNMGGREKPLQNRDGRNCRQAGIGGTHNAMNIVVYWKTLFHEGGEKRNDDTNAIGNV
jgi:hypothetical protein